MKKKKTKDHVTLSLFSSLAKIAAPPPKLKVSDWADNYRKLSSEASAEPGQWRTDRAPYQKEIMDSINDPAIENIVVMSSAQVGKTELLLNTIGYFIDYDPSPILLLQPTLEMGQAFSKDRLAPMLRDTPKIHGKVKDARSRDSGNTMLHKTFPGGHITIAGANSPASLASRPIRVLLADEVDRFPPTAGSEGDPLSLAAKRTTTFWNKKKFYVSTPTIKGASRIEIAYEDSTMEQWQLTCPSCGEYQPLTWGQIVFPKDQEIKPEDVKHKCAKCDSLHGEFEWKAQRGKWVARKSHRNTRGFHLNELVSPWKRWSEIVEDFRAAKAGGPEMLKVWVNTSLGETWEEDGQSVDEDILAKRREYYDAELPENVLVLTAAVDVQDDRLETEVVGWGLDKESWGIEYKIIHGKPNQKEVWDDLSRYLDRTFYFEDGRGLRISCTCIDSGGHFTNEVYEFCLKNEHRRIFAIKGKGGQGVPLISKPSRSNRKKVALFTIGVDTGKELIMSRLKVEDEGRPGYCHFPRESERGYDEKYFQGLTSEKRVIRYHKGRPKIEWVKKYSGGRNEPLDLRNYATAALEILNPNLEALQRIIGKKEVAQQVVSAPAGARKKRKVISKGLS